MNMGLLDGMLGNVLGGLMGGGQQGGANPLLNAVIGMIANGGKVNPGGLGGLVEQFQKAGMGEQIGSWIGNGQNMPISAEQLQQALGSDTIGNIASQLGMGQGEAAGQLSQMLPEIINMLTPNGEAPQGGLGSAEDIMGALGGLLRK
jgi:uncharacterized protein YidB (DUF937 family)